MLVVVVVLATLFKTARIHAKKKKKKKKRKKESKINANKKNRILYYSRSVSLKPKIFKS